MCAQSVVRLLLIISTHKHNGSLAISSLIPVVAVAAAATTTSRRRPLRGLHRRRHDGSGWRQRGQRRRRGGRRRTVQHEAVVDGGQLGQSVLLQAHEAGQRGGLFARASHAVDDVSLLLLTDEQNVEDLELAGQTGQQGGRLVSWTFGRGTVLHAKGFGNCGSVIALIRRSNRRTRVQ